MAVCGRSGALSSIQGPDTLRGRHRFGLPPVAHVPSLGGLGAIGVGAAQVVVGGRILGVEVVEPHGALRVGVGQGRGGRSATAGASTATIHDRHRTGRWSLTRGPLRPFSPKAGLPSLYGE